MDDHRCSRPPIDHERLGSLLADIPAEVQVLDAAPSTNAVAAERALAGAPHGSVVVAEHQTAGRGRLDRGWSTPARSALTFSVVLRPDVPAQRWPWLPLLTGYAVHRALAAEGVQVGLKWPNDVLVEDRKLAGILVERREAPAGPVAVVGIGLNVSLAADELPVPTATSLQLATGAVPDRTELLAGLLRALLAEHDAWANGDGGRLRERYADACTTVGREVRVELPAAEPLRGRAVGIDGDGRLVIDHGGKRTAVAAGDVVHVRPLAGPPEE